jgi:hypothetical protein
VLKVDTIKALATYSFAFLIVGVAYHGLVLYQFELPELVQGALIAWGGSAIAFVFASETSKAASAATQRAYDKGLATPTPATTTTTTTEGPPATSTTVSTGETPGRDDDDA